MSAEPSALQRAREAPSSVALGPRALGRLRVRELPAAAVLAGIVVASAALRVVLAAAVPGPGIFPDENLYAELAKSVSSGDFLVRDVPFSAWTFGPLYALLVAPAYLITSLPDAYLAAQITNSIVMSLAAIPAYFLARRVADERLARVAAALAVLLPAMAYSSRIMTESAFYPLFLCFALAAVRMLERPTAGRQLAALGTIAVAAGVRPQALILVPVLLTAILASSSPQLASLAAYRTTGYALAAVIGLAAAGAIGASAGSSLAERAGDIAGGMDLLAVPKWLLYHVAELDLALGVIAFAGALLFLGQSLRDRSVTPGARAFAAVTAAATVWMVLLAGAFASQPDVGRVQERYLFYVEPLLLIAFLGWIGAGARRGRFALLVALGAAILPLALPFGSLLDYHAYASTPGLLPWLMLEAQIGLVAMVALLAVLCIAVAAVCVRARAPRSLVLPALAYLLVATLLVAGGFQAVSKSSLVAGVGSEQDRAWVDRTVGPDAEVAVLWSASNAPQARNRLVWVTEFFNRSIGPVYYLREPLPYGLPEERVSLRARTVIAAGTPLQAEYVLSDGPPLDGTRVAALPSAGLTLYRVGGVVRLASR